MLSKNEYGPLKTILVGDATSARIPILDESLRCVNYAHEKNIDNIPASGFYPKQVIAEANEDIEIFISFLKEQKIEVVRPNINVEPSYYNFCPRDTLMVYDDKVLYTPMALRARANEYQAYTHIFKKYDNIKQKICEIKRSNELYNEECVGNKNILALSEIEPCFDAANILKNNDDIFYLVSNSGNHRGAELLQEFLGTTARVHKIENVYSYMHLDSTIALLRDGLLLVNPARIKDKDQLPAILRNWDIIWSPEPVDIGHYPGYCNSSPWLNVNLLSINENLVVLEEHQKNLQQELKKYKIESAMLPMRHARTLGGCFHCITVDIERN